jgi:hypothetical protein
MPIAGRYNTPGTRAPAAIRLGIAEARIAAMSIWVNVVDQLDFATF